MEKYNCPHCGAELYWDVSANCLKCEYCEHEYMPEDLSAASTAQEINDTELEESKNVESFERDVDEMDHATDDSESADLVVYSCENCGAEIITARSTVATTCAFCGRAITLTNKMVGDFKPECVIPFSVDEEAAKEIYKNYCKKAVLSPKMFKTQSVIKKVKGVYVPFWLHSFQVDANAVVYAENTTSHKRGDDKIIEHHMYDINMAVSGMFASVPEDGLSNLDNSLMAAIEPFDYSKISEFNPAYMAGFYAEEYDESSEDTLWTAHNRSEEAMESEIISNAGIYSSKSIRTYTPSYSKEQSEYAMLPVWLLNVTYKDKDYQFAVNGETGKVAGKLPISVPKLIGSIVGSGVIVQAAALIIRLLG